MNNEITKHPDLIKKEGIIRDLQKQLKKKQTTLKSLKTRLQNMQKDVEDISRKVQTMVMAKLEEIDKLRNEIAELARVLKKSKNIGREDKEALTAIAEELSEDDEMFGSGYAKYKEQKEKMETGDFDFDEEHRAKFRNIFQEFQVKPPEKEQKNIRKIYLKLSQKFHPDLAKNKKEEEDFHKMMLQINDAYQKNDIHTLLELERMHLMESFDFDSSSMTIDVLDKEIERLEREVKFLEGQINRTSAEVKNLRKSELGQMLTSINRAEKDGEGFDEMAAQQDEMIAALTQVRDGLKESVEIDGISPKITEIIFGNPGGGYDDDSLDDLEAMMQMMNGDKEPSPEEMLEMLSKMMTQSDGHAGGGDFFEFGDIFDMEEEYEKIEDPKFPVGSFVKVKANRKNYIDEETRMKGWEGQVIEAYYDEDGAETYKVSFDSQTINQIPDDLIQEAVLMGVEFNEEDFLEKELTATKSRDTEIERIAACRQRFHQWNWELYDEAQGQRIKKIMLTEVSLPDTANWDNYFQKHLTFPFSAKTRGVYEFGGIPGGRSCQVYGFEYLDAENGFIMSIKPRGSRQRITHPLVDLQAVKGSKKMKEALDDYHEWGGNILEL